MRGCVGQDFRSDALQSPSCLLPYLGIVVGKGRSQNGHCFFCGILRPGKTPEYSPSPGITGGRQGVCQSRQKRPTWERRFAQRLSGSKTEVLSLPDQTLDDSGQEDGRRICVEPTEPFNDGETFPVSPFVENLFEVWNGLWRQVDKNVNASIVAFSVREFQSEGGELWDCWARRWAENAEAPLRLSTARWIQARRTGRIFLRYPFEQDGKRVRTNSSNGSFMGWHFNCRKVRSNLICPVGKRTASIARFFIRGQHGKGCGSKSEQKPYSHTDATMEVSGG